jgi:YVTN family beta-propeller protein
MRNRRPFAAALFVMILLFVPVRRSEATCGPFTDVPSGGFCPLILEIYNLEITFGITTTTFGPTDSVQRQQMAAFLARNYERTTSRTSRRAALGQWWSESRPRYDQGFGLTTVGTSPNSLQSDGFDLWVPNSGTDTVSRVRGSDGQVKATWTGASTAVATLVALGRVFVIGSAAGKGKLFSINPATQVGTTVTTLISDLGDIPQEMTFDGTRIWTTNQTSVSIIDTSTWTATKRTIDAPYGIAFDGNNVWVTSFSANGVKKLDSAGNVLKTVVTGSSPVRMVFDGDNLWVTDNSDNSLTVVRVSDGVVVKQFSAANGNQNGINIPQGVAFDGQRILVTSIGGASDGVLSLFKASDLSIIGNLTTDGAIDPGAVCSDGVYFWISFFTSNAIGRY